MKKKQKKIIEDKSLRYFRIMLFWYLTITCAITLLAFICTICLFFKIDLTGVYYIMPNTRGDNTQVITPYGIIILIITFVATCANTLLIFKSKHKINLFYFGILEILFFILFITTTIGIYSNPRLFLPSYAEYIYEGPNEWIRIYHINDYIYFHLSILFLILTAVIVMLINWYHNRTTRHIKKHHF